MHSNKTNLPPLLLAAILVSGCTASVAVDGDWGDGITGRNQQFSKVLVVGVSPDAGQRCPFEQSMTANLRSDLVSATMSCAVLGSKEPLSREAVERAAASIGADAVLAARLVDASASGTFGAYGVPVVYAEFLTAPSVFSVTGTAEILTDVFDARDASLVYTLAIKAKNLASRETALAEIAPAIAEQLRSDGVIR